MSDSETRESWKLEVSILPQRRSCEGLGNGASHGNRGLPPSGTGASRREQFAALRAANGKARRTFVLRALLTLAAIYSRGTCRPTTIDVPMFHFRVRNGTGWGHWAMTTRFLLDARFVARCCHSAYLVIVTVGSGLCVVVAWLSLLCMAG